MNLFQLTADQRELLSMVENAELSLEDAADTLDGMSFDIDRKIENVCFVLRAMQARETAIGNEIDRLATIKESTKAGIARLKDYALQGMIAADKKKIESDLFNVSVRNGRDIVKITAEGIVPNAFCKTRPATSSPDKAAILKALKDGDEIAGCELTKSDKTISIK